MVRNVLLGVPLFSTLSDEELDKVGAVAEVKSVPARTQLFACGEPSTSFFVIASGTVQIRIPRSAVAPERRIDLGAGKFFGEMGAMQGKPRMADATVLEDSELVVIDEAHFNHLMAVEGGISAKIMQAFLERAGEVSAATRAAERAARDPRVLLFVGAGGGAGASFLVANLGAKIRELTQKSVLVLDLDLGLPSCHLYLGEAKPNTGLRELRGRREPNGAELQAVARHLAHGPDLLGDLDSSEAVGPEPAAIEPLVRAARQGYEYVLIDAPSAGSAVIDELARVSDAIHVVVPPEPAGVTRGVALLKRLKGQGHDGRIRVVLGRQRAKGGLDGDGIEYDLGETALARIGDDDALAREALTEGQPVTRLKPSSVLSEQVNRLARQLLSLPVGPQTQQRSFSIWNLFG